MMATGAPRDYLLALAQWKIPYEIVFMVMAAIYFLPILRTEALNVFLRRAVTGYGTKKKRQGERNWRSILKSACQY